MIQTLLERQAEAGALRWVDLYFARHLAELAGTDAPGLLLAAALASQRLGEGDVCVELDRAHEYPLVRAAAEAGLAPASAAAWRAALARCPRVVGTPQTPAPGASPLAEQTRPLMIDAAGRLYLGRYWYFEQDLARQLITLAEAAPPPVDEARLDQDLARLFPSQEAPDRQRAAAELAVRSRLAVISGGPGTGKTRTVAAILALLVGQAPDTPPRIALTAPTGKAAARLSESIGRACTALGLDPGTLPHEAMTLHRLIGMIPGSSTPRFHAENPLGAEVVILDEASMADLPLMARLVAALPRRGRLILLGDKDQLASVEAGAVLGDICGRGAVRADGIGRCVQVLTHSYRFDEQSGIGALARAINAGDGDVAVALLEEGRYADAALAPAPDEAALRGLIRQHAVPAFAGYLAGSRGATDPAGALQAFHRFRVLCALREGPFGVRHLNRLVEEELARAGLIHPQGAFYPGRPVMVTANDHALRLYNGDIGLILPDPDGGGLRVFFEQPGGPPRSLSPTRLPPHETAFALTVHKSQGSEFDEVLFVLPDRDGPILTRELVYTGITRARTRVLLAGATGRIRHAAMHPVERASGLFDALYHPAPPH